MDETAMPTFRIHRLRDHLKQSFRYAPHVSGAATIKPRDYLPGETAQTSSPYSLYFELRNSGTALEPGDVLENETGGLRIFKFVGFEEARWVVPEGQIEPHPDLAASSVAASPVATPAAVE
ncbi:MAG TPA: hypothetical protein VGN17_14375 [Bryobacteraceae bacterium]|jgi:hypothetical protein